MESHSPNLRAIAGSKHLHSFLAQRARLVIFGNDSSILWILSKGSMHFGIYFIGIVIGQKFIHVANTFPRYYSLNRYSVPTRELHFQMLQQLDLKLIIASTPWGKFYVTSLTWIAVVVLAIRDQKALPKSSACTNAAQRRPRHRLSAVHRDHLFVIECEGTISLCNKVIDNLNFGNIQSLLQLISTHHPIKIGIPDSVVSHHTSYCQNAHGRERKLGPTFAFIL
mmetsp:Transcript_107233/g.201864  ORF Transcript_107233/g.201864 Transcript_107233/m.201864 type:complete len:224 (-) Transcript_107233:358-1029(-)